MGSSLHVFFRNVTAVYPVSYLHDIPKLSRRTVRGTVGLIVRLLDTGFKEREGKAAPSQPHEGTAS